MWDLDTLRYLNEQAHLEAVERAKQQAQVTAKQATAPVYPLAILSRKLIISPPSLAHLIDLFESSDDVAYFHDLVREYLPEREAFIMAQDTEGRIREFAYYFGQKYFPLSDNIFLDDSELYDFLRFIPVDLMGFTYDDFHNFNDFREGFILMLALVESPYSDDEARGGRIPILERTAELVGKDLVELIPNEGWSSEELHRMLDKTDYEGLALFCDWVNSNTGCWQLDANYDDYMGEEWERGVVDELTRQWPRVVDIQNKYTKMTAWLEEDMHYNFSILLGYILDRKDLKELVIPKEQLAFQLDDLM